MRLRQLVIVAEERDSIANQICDVFDLKVAFHDDGLIHFGLINSLIPLGDTFIEIVTPVKENTTAERFLNRRGGNGGYMVICLLYTSPSPRDRTRSRMPSSA